MLDHRPRRPVLGEPHRTPEATGLGGLGRAPEGFDAATLYAYTLPQPDTAACVRDTLPVLGSPTGLAAEAVVCAMVLQTVARGDNHALEDQLRTWAEELHRRCPRGAALR
ncbi:hypothetical protein [Streptomyces olivochromogenes]|uniref:hypothetical protein n=1 Tax=Streptomyces olivochromogenes TaxID=1963 RepID=UPI001F1AB7DA|nr:hypothetical protein [Streptomyces olivochromogenes]MCF3131671.1 hypothetical protein [Streptomyces olivochromogenes]